MVQLKKKVIIFKIPLKVTEMKIAFFHLFVQLHNNAVINEDTTQYSTSATNV